jgi:hypothetical protein
MHAFERRAPKRTEPRFHDLRVAERLGFTRPRNIRKLIERNLPDLGGYGEVCSMVEQTSEQGGRPPLSTG